MEEEADFDSFDHDDAWRLGSDLVQRCRDEGLAVTVVIHLGEQRVFHAAMRGTSADNDDWAMRKTRIVRRFDQSSGDVGRTYATDYLAFFTGFGLSPADYAPAGGAVPIRVRGALVGVLAVSGLDSDADDALARSALAAHHG